MIILIVVLLALAALIAVVLVVVLHKWKHNSLISILSGTVAYMLLLHVF